MSNEPGEGDACCIVATWEVDSVWAADVGWTYSLRQCRMVLQLFVDAVMTLSSAGMFVDHRITGTPRIGIVTNSCV